MFINLKKNYATECNNRKIALVAFAACRLTERRNHISSVSSGATGDHAFSLITEIPSSNFSLINNRVETIPEESLSHHSRRRSRVFFVAFSHYVYTYTDGNFLYRVFGTKIQQSESSNAAPQTHARK